MPPSPFGGLVQDFENALPRGDALLQRTAHIDQAAQWRWNEEQGRQKPEEFVQRQIAGLNLMNRHEQHAAQRDRGDALHDRIADGLGAHQFHVGGTVVFVDQLEALRLVILGVENLDQTQGIDGFLCHPRDVAH